MDRDSDAQGNIPHTPDSQDAGAITLDNTSSAISPNSVEPVNNSTTQQAEAPIIVAEQPNITQSTPVDLQPQADLPDGSITTPATPEAQPHKSKKHHHKSKTAKNHNDTSPVVYVRRPIALVILMITLIILLLAGAGLATWYFVYYNNPEKVALDAISGFLNEKSVVIDGVLKTEYDHTSIMLSLESNSASPANSSKMTLTVSPLDANSNVLYAQPYQVDIGSVVMSDGILYIRIDDLTDAIDQYLEDHSISASSLDALSSLGYDIADTIDGEWWQISVPDLIDEYVDSASDAQSVKELYACMINVANRDIRQELSQLYSDHQFIKISRIQNPSAYSEAVSKGFNSLYRVEFDYDQMADFINSLPQSDTANNIYNCLNHFSETSRSRWRISSEDFNEISADDLRKGLSGLESIELEITNFGHQLVGVSYSDDNNLVGLSFTYQSVSINPPSRYHRFTELIDELSELVFDSYKNFYNDTDIESPTFDEWGSIEDYELPVIDEIETT